MKQNTMKINKEREKKELRHLTSLFIFCFNTFKTCEFQQVQAFILPIYTSIYLTRLTQFVSSHLGEKF